MIFITTPSAIAALTCTGTISLIPNLILFLFPNFQGQDSLFLSTGQSLAAGGLLGDVFLHTLPHSSDLEAAGIWILTGFTVFLMVDIFIRSIEGGHSQSHHAESKTDRTTTNCSNGDRSKQAEEHSLWWSSTILLNLSADALHNFTDGIAIGVSFSLGVHSQDDSVWELLKGRGGLAFLSIFFHEVPHELGDYCVLVHSGLSKREAIAAQFATAVAAMVGTMVGLWGAATQHSDALMYMTSGGFLYLAAVNILPSVLEETTAKSTIFQVAQTGAFFIGIAFMYDVAVLEKGVHSSNDHQLESHHHHHGDEF